MDYTSCGRLASWSQVVYDDVYFGVWWTMCQFELYLVVTWWLKSVKYGGVYCTSFYGRPLGRLTNFTTAAESLLALTEMARCLGPLDG